MEYVWDKISNLGKNHLAVITTVVVDVVARQ
jgi:hypothetical protein